MDAKHLNELLVRLSLDGKNVVEASGMKGFPLLRVNGDTLIARPKTVLVTDGVVKHAPRPGVEFVIVNMDGICVPSFAGEPCFPGVSSAPLDGFLRRFGHLFEVNEIEIESPEDPFIRLLMA